MPELISIEQTIRDILTQAIADNLVAPATTEWSDPDPQCRSASELVGTANLLDEVVGIAFRQRHALTQTIRAILKHCTNECDEITASDCLDAIQETCFAALDAVDPEQKAAGTEIPAAHPASPSTRE